MIMKARYVLISLAIVTLLGACSREEKDLFDKSAAQRAQVALDNAFSILTEETNGWEMIYFANPESEGYNLIMEFDANGRVSATAKNATTTNNKILTDESTWAVKNDNGPILTFDTYNKVFHAWSDPRDDGDGLLGDYEFLILHADANHVKLKGKKHSAYCYLYPMESGKTPATYFAEIEATRTRFVGNGNLFHAVTPDGECLLNNGSSGVFYRSQVGEKPAEEDPELYPFGIRTGGIQLSLPLPEAPDTWYALSGSVFANDNSSTIFTASPAAYFGEYTEIAAGAWVVNLEDINDISKQAIDAVNAALKKAYSTNKKAAIKSLAFSQKDNGFVLTLGYLGTSSSKATEMDYLYSFEQQSGSVRLNYLEPADENAQKVLAAFPSLEPLFKSLNGTFALAAGDAVNPTLGMKMTENSNSSVWFNITGKK